MNTELSRIATCSDLEQVVGSRLSMNDKDRTRPRVIGVLEQTETGYYLRCYKQGVDRVLIREDDFALRAPRLEM